MHVPFLDLKAHHGPLHDQFTQAIAEVIASSAFAGGPFVEKFEAEFAAYCGCRHAIGVGNGTDALWLSLLACGVGPGDEVITVPNTFVATAEAIILCGARPVFVDVDATTYTMDPAGLQKALTPRTKAIIPVHLFGQPADMDPIVSFAEKHRLIVIEDAAQAHGAEYKAKKAGTIGATGCFSFYPGKNLGAFGEAGAVLTNDSELNEKIRILRDHGQARKYRHTVIGWNCRMDGIQAAVLSLKLKRLENFNLMRRTHAAEYNRELHGIDDIVLPAEAPHSRHVYHVYAIRVKEREAMMWMLKEKEIECSVHYPVPIHLQKAYDNLGYESGDFPVSEAIAREFISLPMFPELTDAQTRAVGLAVKESAYAAVAA
jgi:dTDP-4-amino-4,6-dideoxygalactose transaminase